MIIPANHKILRYPLWSLAAMACAGSCAAALSHNGAWLLLPVAGLITCITIVDIPAVFCLLVFTLPFSLEYSFAPSLGTDLPDEPLMIGLALTFLLCMAACPARLQQIRWRHPLLGVLCLQVAWMIIPVVFSSFPLLSFKYLLAKGWYLLAFVGWPLLLWPDKAAFRRVFRLLFIALFTVTTIILVRHAGKGFSFETANKIVSPFFRNHVNYSAMLVCFFPFVVAAFALSRKGSWQRKGLLMVILFFMSAILFSYARGAWMGLLIGALVFVLVKLRLAPAAILITYLAVAISFSWLAWNNRYLNYAPQYEKTIYHASFRKHLAATYKGQDLSTAERFYRWIAGVRMSHDRWITGYGPATFYENYRPYTVNRFRTYVSNNAEHSTVHNYFLLVLIEQGVPGLLLFAALMWCIFYYGQHTYHRLSDPFFKTTCMATLVMMGVIGTVNFLSDLIETDKVGPLFFMGIALLVSLSSVPSKENAETAPL